ncbi:MAG: hypothetical protein ABIC68_05735 [Candidatus Omnitrophota bacterium]
MKKPGVLLVLIVFTVLLQPFLAFADAVYLKNGTVMTGRIVEKTPDYIVLKTSEDEDAVKVTVFLEDIYKIEEQDVFVDSLKYIPYDLLHGASATRLTVGQSTLSPVSDVDSLSAIKNLLELNRQYQVASVTEDEDEARNIISMTPQERQEALERMQKEKQQVTIAQVKEKLIQESREVVKSGDGSVCGHVFLPDLPYEKRTRGDLYIYLMEDLGNGQFGFYKDLYFTKISYKNIVSRKVAFKIEHVPQGRYKVFAQWDIEFPFVKEKVLSSGKKILGYLGAKGDYSGNHHEVFDLAADEKKEGLDFSCEKLIYKDQFAFDLSKEPLVNAKDLYFQKLPLKEGRIILLVENNTEGFISLAAFDILVNGEKVLNVPYQLNGLEPHSEKEFDITQVYNLYKNKKALEGEEVNETLVTIKIIWPPTGEVVLEKVVQVF